jgi:hypothetical protein
MIEGGLIAESLRVGTNLENLMLTVPRSVGSGPGRPQPTSRTSGPCWTSKQTKPRQTSSPGPSPLFLTSRRYMNFQSPAESFVVFPGRIFRYRGATKLAGPTPRLTAASSPSPSGSWTGPCEAPVTAESSADSRLTAYAAPSEIALGRPGVV